MVWTTVLFGVLLIAFGVSGYFAAEQTFWPALIAIALGLALLVAGLLAFKQTFRKNAMHVAVLLALLGLVGTAHALFQLVKLVIQQSGLVIESVTAGLCAVFIWLSIRSFIEARRPKSVPEQPPVEQGGDERGGIRD
jgi:uncharacterized membrane protein